MAERDEEMIRGTVQSIVFQNAENGYTVLRLRTEGGEQITVTGTIPMTLVGERLVIAGKWGRHPSHGPQFEAEFLERLMPETTQEIFSYLSSRAVRASARRPPRRSWSGLVRRASMCWKTSRRGWRRSPASRAPRPPRCRRASGGRAACAA